VSLSDTLSQPITFHLTETLDELRQVKEIQNRHQKESIALELRERNGFVTAEYEISLLKKMHRLLRSIIAKEGDKVVGYALVTDRRIVGYHDLLDDLFDQINKLTFDNHPLKDANYTVVGQLCVDSDYGRRGIAQGLYKKYQESYSDSFDYCITDVDCNNPRSLRTHLRAGFQIIHKIEYGNAEWDIVLWDWKTE
jgi:ribosomal protein S18 acetylase RimI-like enzyme